MRSQIVVGPHLHKDGEDRRDRKHVRQVSIVARAKVSQRENTCPERHSEAYRTLNEDREKQPLQDGMTRS